MAVGLPPESMLDLATLPIAELATLAKRESHRPRPVYTAHKWFARRFGTAMRALLVASTQPSSGNFWEAFHGGADMRGMTVVDLFIGGGTSVYEARRLGADVVGVDIDPVACLVSEFEVEAHNRPDPRAALAGVISGAEEQRELYATTGPDGERREGLHFFWVQQVECENCSSVFDAHPSATIAHDGENDWVVCLSCGDIHHVAAAVASFDCGCGARPSKTDATLTRGRATCPICSHGEQLIDHARRTGSRPRFRMFAIESVPPSTSARAIPIRDRLFHRPTEEDLNRFDLAAAALDGRRGELPERLIPLDERSDTRLSAYGHRRYVDLFNDRQLLHLLRLKDLIDALDEEARPSFAMAYSNHLTSNCMLTRYTPRWRQATPLFSLRSFVHSARPIELNPWLVGTGRGTFPNAVRKVANAIDFAKSPRELTREGFVPIPTRADEASATIINGDSRSRPEIADASADVILTDPPYLDNIDYSELSDFFLPWLDLLGQVTDPGRPSPKSLAAKSRRGTPVADFQAGLVACFTEAARILKPGGRMIFTFQHQSDAAWAALSHAMHDSRLEVVNVFTMQGDSESSLHRHANSTTWDAVFVLRRPTQHGVTSAPALAGADHVARCIDWADRQGKHLGLGAPDIANLRRAVVAAGGTGFLAENAAPVSPVRDVLRSLPAVTPERHGYVDLPA